MPLPWPGIASVGGDLAEAEQNAITAMLDRFGERVGEELVRAGYPQHVSPLFRPWNIAVAKDAQKVLVSFAPISGGVANVFWIDQTSQYLDPAALRQWVQSQQGWQPEIDLVFTHPGSPEEATVLEGAVMGHLADVERGQVLGKLGDLAGVRHLEPHLREFLATHPDPDRNVFVMMRFLASDQLDGVYAAIRETLAARGLHAVRADDRDYTGELWSNIEVYLTCCNYGVAVFEDIERRDFNPNVSLELGYMLGRRKRCLILKERRLPDLPADVVHRLYKPWDVFKISESIGREVGKWVDVDLGLQV